MMMMIADEDDSDENMCKIGLNYLQEGVTGEK